MASASAPLTCLLSLRPPEGNWVDDSTTMQWAIPNGAVVCASTAPNLWVGAVVTAIDGSIFDGAISQPGDPHAEVAALAAAGDRVLGCHADRDVGAMCASRPHTTVYDAIVAAGIRHVVGGIEDPDSRHRWRHRRVGRSGP